MEDVIIYDKAKYHYEGKFPKNLPRRQAYVHTGMFVAWLALHQCLSEKTMSEFKSGIQALQSRTQPPSSLYVAADGVLSSDMLSETGNQFARAYFDFENGLYLEDYEHLLCGENETLFEVDDTWGNYESIARRVDERFNTWKKERLNPMP